jgi:ferritin-like metal-binding protein YciE
MSHSSIEQLSNWLRDAYSMEESLVKVLESHVHDAEELPEIRERLEQHLKETRRHVELVSQCLDQLGEKPSEVKSMIGALTGMVQGAASGTFRDGLLKNFLSDFAAENFEIACYRSLIAAADELDQPGIAARCLEILGDEEMMAEWLEERIPDVTRMTLEQLAHN